MMKREEVLWKTLFRTGDLDGARTLIKGGLSIDHQLDVRPLDVRPSWHSLLYRACSRTAGERRAHIRETP